MAYPTVDVSTVNLDVGTDNPALARTELLDLAQKFNLLRPLPADLSAASGPSLLGFDRTLNYAVATLGGYLSTLRVNVRQYPWLAKGDGTDDHDAIQAAITYVVSKGGGTVYFPNPSTFYGSASTLNIANSGNSITFEGDGIWLSELRHTGATPEALLNNVLGKLFINGMTLTGQDPGTMSINPNAASYRNGDIGISTTGVINLDRVAINGFQYLVSPNNTGYYHKFHKTDFRWCETALYGFDANNLSIDKCAASHMGSFCMVSSGIGPVVATSSSFEKFMFRAFGVAGGASPLIVCNGCYFENYTSTPVGAALLALPGSTATFATGIIAVNPGDTLLTGNTFNMSGILRIFSSGGICRTIRSFGNTISYQAGANSDSDVLFSIGTVTGSVYLRDHARPTLTGQTGGKTTVAYGAIVASYPESCLVINPITLVDETPDAGWTDATLLNGWTNKDIVNYRPAGYKKVGKRVWLRGYITGATATTSTIFALPAGLRPITVPYRVLSANTNSTTPVAVSLRAQSNGDFFVGNSAYTALTTLPLDGLSFEID